ncbi:MAG: helix-turn-helix domain-containing protein [Bryobacteraceae bacterium]
MLTEVIELAPDCPHLHGATLAQQHLSEMLPQFNKLNGSPAVFLLNLVNATSVTGSYLRGTVYWALLCGQADATGNLAAPGLDKWAVRPLPLFPAIIGGSDEVVDDVNDFFTARNLPILQASKRSKSELVSARLLGSLDLYLAATLLTLAKLREATAGELAASSGETITVNAWSNRLNDLFSLRLVTRRRDGKFWRYSPAAKEINTWA